VSRKPAPADEGQKIIAERTDHTRLVAARLDSRTNSIPRIWFSRWNPPRSRQSRNRYVRLRNFPALHLPAIQTAETTKRICQVLCSASKTKRRSSCHRFPTAPLHALQS